MANRQPIQNSFVVRCIHIITILAGGFMRKWQCLVCGFIYDEARGLPEEGIPPGASWDDIPDDWECPECGVGKEDFEMLEI